MRSMKRLLVAAAAAAFASGCAGYGDPGHEELDTDLDGWVDGVEFGTYAGDLGVYDDWDRDDDGFVDAAEWEESFDETGLRGDWDLDESVFGQWDSDRDERLSRDETRAGLFDLWDTNDDGVLDEGEFESGAA